MGIYKSFEIQENFEDAKNALRFSASFGFDTHNFIHSNQASEAAA